MLIILIFSPLIILFVHMALSRVLHSGLSGSRQAVAVKAGVVGAVPTGFLLWRFAISPLDSGQLLAALYCLAVYASLAYTYFHFFNMSETARRIRILYEIHKAGSLPAKEIISLYKASGIVDLRLQRLVETNQLKLKDGYYSIDGKTLYYAALFIEAWMRLLGFSRRRIS